MSKLKYKVGDLIEAAKTGEVDVIAQQNNCYCTRKSGIAPLIDKAFPKFAKVEDSTKKFTKEKLGRISYAIYSTSPVVTFDCNGTRTEVDEIDLIIFGLYGQLGWWGRKKGQRDTDYKALSSAFSYMEKRLGFYRDKDTCKIGLPLLGCGLAGGDWKVVSQIVEEELCSKGWDVTVYVLDEKDIPS